MRQKLIIHVQYDTIDTWHYPGCGFELDWVFLGQSCWQTVWCFKTLTSMPPLLIKISYIIGLYFDVTTVFAGKKHQRQSVSHWYHEPYHSFNTREAYLLNSSWTEMWWENNLPTPWWLVILLVALHEKWRKYVGNTDNKNWMEAVWTRTCGRFSVTRVGTHTFRLVLHSYRFAIMKLECSLILTPEHLVRNFSIATDN